MKERIMALALRLTQNELISGSFYLFLGTTLSNILAFLFNIFIVRHLSYGQYAEVSALVSLITLASILAQAFMPTIVQFAGRYFAKNEVEKAAELFHQATWKIAILALFAFFIFVLLSHPLGLFLHITNSFEIILVGGVVGVIYLSSTNTSFLQSKLRFGFLALTTIIGGVIKLFVGMGLITIGLGIFGVLWSYFLTYLVPYLVTFIPLIFLITAKQKKIEIHSREIFVYGLPTALAIFSLSSFTSTDILLVKHFFSPIEAAQYSGLSLVGRIIFYFSAPITTVMFPILIKRYHQGGRLEKLLLASFGLVLLPSLALSFLYFIFPKIIISIFLGSKYMSVAPYLGWFGLYLCVFSLINVLVNFFLSIKKTKVTWFISAGAVMQLAGITLFHQTIGIVIFLSFFLCLVLFVILLLYYMRLYAKK